MFDVQRAKPVVAWMSAASTSTAAVRASRLSNGGPYEIDGNENGLRSLHLDGNFLYFATGTAVHYAPKSGGGPVAVAVPNTTDIVRSVVKVPGQLLYLRGTVVAHCAVSGEFGCDPSVKATEVQLEGGVGDLLAAERDGDNVWLTTSMGIGRKPTSGSYLTSTFWSVFNVSALVADDTRVYFLVQGQQNVFAKLQTEANGDRTILTNTQTAPHAIAVDAANVYFTLPESNQIAFVPRGNDPSLPPTTFVENVRTPLGIAVTQTRVLVTTGEGYVLSFPKP